MSAHTVKNDGDFLSCTVDGCRWSATWSMGHICDHCGEQAHAGCKCKCPMSRDDMIKLYRRLAKKGELDLWKFERYIALGTESEKISQAYNYGQRVALFALYEILKSRHKDRLEAIIKDKIAGYKAGYDSV